MATKSKLSLPVPTLVDVAKLACVGLGTASRAINGQGYIKEETMARIQMAAERLGYQPNEMARNLKRRRSGAIGLIVPDIGGPFMANCVRAIQQVLRQNGYKSIIGFTDGDEKNEIEEIDYMVSYQIDGLIIVPASLNGASQHYASSRMAKIPVVAFDQPITNRPCDAVLVKNKKGAKEAVQHLIEHGHTRIGCIGVNRQYYSIQKRIAGYREAIAEAKLSPLLSIVEMGNDGVGNQIRRWMSLKKPPTAIFSLNEFTTLAAVQAFAQQNIKMPGQVAFIGFDDVQLGEYYSPPLTAVLQPAAKIGEHVAAQILRLIGNPEPPSSKREMLDVSLIIRGSCGCNVAHAAGPAVESV